VDAKRAGAQRSRGQVAIGKVALQALQAILGAGEERWLAPALGIFALVAVAASAALSR